MVLQVQRRRLRDLKAFQLPGQSNRLALVFNPLDDVGVPFTFGLEIFERNHCTPPHVHSQAHELFFILSGRGTAFCDGRSFPVAAGDIVVFPPTSGAQSSFPLALSRSDLTSCRAPHCVHTQPSVAAQTCDHWKSIVLSERRLGCWE